MKASVLDSIVTVNLLLYYQKNRSPTVSTFTQEGTFVNVTSRKSEEPKAQRVVQLLSQTGRTIAQGLSNASLKEGRHPPQRVRRTGKVACEMIKSHIP